MKLPAVFPYKTRNIKFTVVFQKYIKGTYTLPDVKGKAFDVLLPETNTNLTFVFHKIYNENGTPAKSLWAFSEYTTGAQLVSVSTGTPAKAWAILQPKLKDMTEQMLLDAIKRATKLNELPAK